MPKARLEWILGFKLRGEQLTLAPCVPASWPGFSIVYRHRGTIYEIGVDRQPAPNAKAQLTIDGQAQQPGCSVVDLVDDGGKHVVHVAWLAAAAAAAVPGKESREKGERPH